MKKITLLTKIMFHICNIGLIILYLYPGSIMGWLIFRDFQKQPQITSDFLVSSNHVYAYGLGWGWVYRHYRVLRADRCFDG